MNDLEAVQLLKLLDKYVRLPDATGGEGSMMVKELAADLWESLPDDLQPDELSTVVLPYRLRH